MIDAQWYIVRHGKREGPLTHSELHNRVETGALERSDLAWKPGLADWVQAGTVEGLFEGFSPPASPMAWDATKRHVADLRNKAFWTAIGVTLLLAPSPAVVTKILGEPKAGLEEVLTIWNVLWYTLPLSVAVAIDAGILMRLSRQPDQFPKPGEGRTALWCCLGGVLIGSMLLGGWLGGVEMSEWSEARIGDVRSEYRSIDPSGRAAKSVAHGLANNVRKMRANKWALPAAIVIGSLATIVNYFTLYGPSMFFSSLAVGSFIGWVWAVKLPEVLAEIDRSSDTSHCGGR